MPVLRSSLFSSLQFRMALGFVFALAIALVLIGLATGVVAGKQTQRFERDRESAQVARVQRFISDYYADRGDWSSNRARLQETLEHASSVAGTRIVVYDVGGNVVADSHASVSRSDDGEVGLDGDSGVGGDSDRNSGRRKNVRRFPVLQGHGRGNQEVGTFTVLSVFPEAGPPQDFDDPVAARIAGGVNRSLLWAGIGAAALGTVLVWLLSRHTLAPLQSLGEAARRLGRGDLSQRAEAAGPREIQQLAHSFNTMASGLEDAERQRRNLTADVAHELRTPLSNIQGYLEAIRDGVVQPTPDTIDTIHGQALHLSRLVDDLRLLAQVESGDLQLQLSQVRPGELLQSSVDAVRLRANAKAVALTLDTDAGLPALEVDGARVSQVIGNLLENAITHTPEGGTVTVSARAAEGHVVISVSDTGHGIAPDDLSRVFDRFYRADPSRSRNTGGSGLGLTIARRVVEAHGGTIEAESVVGEGSRFTVRFPLDR